MFTLVSLYDTWGEANRRHHVEPEVLVPGYLSGWWTDTPSPPHSSPPRRQNPSTNISTTWSSRSERCSDHLRNRNTFQTIGTLLNQQLFILMQLHTKGPKRESLVKIVGQVNLWQTTTKSNLKTDIFAACVRDLNSTTTFACAEDGHVDEEQQDVVQEALQHRGLHTGVRQVLTADRRPADQQWQGLAHHDGLQQMPGEWARPTGVCHMNLNATLWLKFIKTNNKQQVSNVFPLEGKIKSWQLLFLCFMFKS